MFKTITTIMAIVFLVGCAKEDKTSPAPVINEYYIETVYQEYYDKFLADAEFYNIPIENKTIAIRTISLLKDENANYLCDQTNRIIYIKERWVKEALNYVNNQVQEDNIWKDIVLKTLVYKTLGRCLLNLNYSDNAGELMYYGLIFQIMTPDFEANTVRQLFLGDEEINMN